MTTPNDEKQEPQCVRHEWREGIGWHKRTSPEHDWADGYAGLTQRCRRCYQLRRLDATPTNPPQEATDAHGASETDLAANRAYGPNAHFVAIEVARSIELRFRQSSAELETTKATNAFLMRKYESLLAELEKVKAEKVDMHERALLAELSLGNLTAEHAELQSALTAERAARTQAEQERDALKSAKSGFVLRLANNIRGWQSDKHDKRTLDEVILSSDVGAILSSDGTARRMEAAESKLAAAMASVAKLKESNAVLQSQVDNSDANIEQMRMIWKPRAEKAEATVAALTMERDEAQKRVKQFCEDWAHDDTAIKDECKPFGIDIEGSSYGVPSMVDCVVELAQITKDAQTERDEAKRELVALMQRVRNEREGDTKRIDTIIANKWTITWNSLRDSFIVQTVNQVCGNIGHSKPLRELIDAAANLAK